MGVKKKRKRRKRPKHNKRAHKLRRRMLHHKEESRKEAEMTNYLLHQMLRTMSDKETDPDMQFHYDPRHHTKDLEYKTSNARMREFKRGVPAPDVQMWRPPPYKMGAYTMPYPPAVAEPAGMVW